MKKTLTILMLFVLGVLLMPTSQVFAEDVPDEDVPEMFDSTPAVVFNIGTVNLTEEPEDDPEPDEAE